MKFKSWWALRKKLKKIHRSFLPPSLTTNLHILSLSQPKHLPSPFAPSFFLSLCKGKLRWRHKKEKGSGLLNWEKGARTKGNRNRKERRRRRESEKKEEGEGLDLGMNLLFLSLLYEIGFFFPRIYIFIGFYRKNPLWLIENKKRVQKSPWTAVVLEA